VSDWSAWTFRPPLPIGAGTAPSCSLKQPSPLSQAPAPESVLKKRKRAEKWEAESKAQAAAAQTKGADKKAEAFKRAEDYIKTYREQEQSLVTLKRAARAKGTYYVEPEPKLLFVMRLRGINGMHPKTRHIMKVLRLLQIHNGVFMRVNKAIMNNLVKVDPYIMYGYPNLKTVSSFPPTIVYFQHTAYALLITRRSVLRSTTTDTFYSQHCTLISRCATSSTSVDSLRSMGSAYRSPTTQ
jgi:ribosomal protein L30/L7E